MEQTQRIFRSHADFSQHDMHICQLLQKQLRVRLCLQKGAGL